MTKKTKDQKRHDEKLLALTVSKTHARAFEIVQEFNQSFFLNDCDINEIPVGIVCQMLNTDDSEIKQARQRRAQEFVGDQWEENVTPLSVYLWTQSGTKAHRNYTKKAPWETLALFLWFDQNAKNSKNIKSRYYHRERARSSAKSVPRLLLRDKR